MQCANLERTSAGAYLKIVYHLQLWLDITSVSKKPDTLYIGGHLYKVCPFFWNRLYKGTDGIQNLMRINLYDGSNLVSLFPPPPPPHPTQLE